MRGTVREAFDGLLSGVCAHELQPAIAALPLTERAALLCTVCAMRDEVACICKETAAQIDRSLNTNCALFAERGVRCHDAARRTCMSPLYQPSVIELP